MQRRLCKACIIDIVKRYLKGAAAQEHLEHELEFQRSLGTCAGNDNDSDTCEEADRDKDEEENKEDSGHTQKKAATQWGGGGGGNRMR